MMGGPGVNSTQFAMALQQSLQQIFGQNAAFGGLNTDAAAGNGEFEAFLGQLFARAMGPQSQPAAASVVAALPKASITEADVEAKATCSVCMEGFSLGEGGVVELPCSHKYHLSSCLQPWLDTHHTCPVCRAPLPTEDPQQQRRAQGGAAAAPAAASASASASAGGSSSGTGGFLSRLFGGGLLSRARGRLGSSTSDPGSGAAAAAPAPAATAAAASPPRRSARLNGRCDRVRPREADDTGGGGEDSGGSGGDAQGRRVRPRFAPLLFSGLGETGRDGGNGDDDDEGDGEGSMGGGSAFGSLGGLSGIFGEVEDGGIRVTAGGGNGQEEEEEEEGEGGDYDGEEIAAAMAASLREGGAASASHAAGAAPYSSAAASGSLGRSSAAAAASSSSVWPVRGSRSPPRPPQAHRSPAALDLDDDATMRSLMLDSLNSLALPELRAQAAAEGLAVPPGRAGDRAYLVSALAAKLGLAPASSPPAAAPSSSAAAHVPSPVPAAAGSWAPPRTIVVPGEPAVGERGDVFTLKLRHALTGMGFTRRFRGSDTLGHVAAAAAADASEQGGASGGKRVSVPHDLRLRLAGAAPAGSSSSSVSSSFSFGPADWDTALSASGVAKRSQLLVETARA